MPYSTAIVPYYARKRAMNFMLSGGYNRTAKRARYVAAHAIKYGPRAIRAGKRIVRQYRRYKRNKTASKARREFGHPVGKSTAKVTNQQLSTSLLTMATRTIYSCPLVRVDKGTTISERERDIINFRGVKICLELNHADTIANPLYFHVAIVSKPRSGFSFGSLSGWTSNVSKDDFFRGSGGTARALNFDLATNFEMHCNPINTDGYNVHYHKKHRLDVNGGGYDKIPFKGYRNIEKYFKFNKQVRFNGSVADSEDQVHILMWCSQFHNFSLTPTASAITVNTKMVTYWREPKN